MGKVTALRCRDCTTEFPPTVKFVCDQCFGALDTVYNYDEIRLTPSSLNGREKSLWRYFDLLPVKDPDRIVNLGAGFNPLRRCDTLAKELGLKHLYVKDDTINPTYSFKDRPSSVAVSKALEFGFKAVGCASTGNLAAALAAHAAKAGLDCYVFIPSDIEANKIVQTAVFGAKIVRVNGTYDDVNRLVTQAADEYGIGIVNVTLRPYYVEGSKTVAFEIAEQLGWEVPDHVIVPLASGALLCAICKGFEELERVGLIDGTDVKVTGVQPQGCSPIVDAFKQGRDEISPVEYPETIAKSLAIGDPSDGIYTLRNIREYGGFAESVPNREIIDSVRLLAQTEGIFAEPTGGVVLGALKRLVEDGRISHDERVVFLITGSGLKAPEAIARGLPEPITVEPRLQALAPIIKR